MSQKTEKIAQVLQKLDAESGVAIFPEMTRGVTPNTRFLIISYGGTGADAMYQLKLNLQKYLKKEDYEDCVRLLVVDTDQRTKNLMKKEGDHEVQVGERFSMEEFHWLSSGPAKNAINNKQGTMTDWINPRLPAMIQADKKYLDGNGASGTRQIGRVLLASQQTVADFTQRVSTLMHDLTDGNADNLKIIIISGISGGTGSGIVVDATYLVQKCIDGIRVNFRDRCKVLGFLLLPPTGTSNEEVQITKGNKNGYAALKEIDHFMHIAHRGEAYSARLGDKRIESKQNIFETCYLVDGNNSTINWQNPKEMANAVVSDCILDMITSQPIASDGAKAAPQGVDSFMSDAATFARAAVSNLQETLAPRNASYMYCTLGHGKTLIPLELMKAYVAKGVFEKIYKTFQQHRKVSGDAVEEFLDKLIDEGTTPSRLRSAMDQAVDAEFKNKSKGPYYTINLLRDLAVAAKDKKEVLDGKLFVIDKEKKTKKLNAIYEEALQLNSNLFEVYVTAMEEMKRYLEQQSGIICDSHKITTYAGSSYTFCPIDLTGVDAKSRIVHEYLDGLINGSDIGKLAEALLKEMVEHREEWTDIQVEVEKGHLPKLAVAERIREFWKVRIGEIVDSTVEDYLIKLYSGDKTAKYQEIAGEATPDTKNALAAAATEIVNKMWGAAGIAVPLASLRTDILTMDNFIGHNLMLIPASCPHLTDAIRQELHAQNYENVNVANSYANDRISFYSQYTGLPAYMFEWTLAGEKAYEDAVQNQDVGLHMSETKGGALWKNFPNLVVENIWPVLGEKYFAKREHDIGMRAVSLFERAYALGLALRKSDEADARVGHYELAVLPQRFRPDTGLFKAYDVEMEGTPAKKAAKKELDAEITRCAEELFRLPVDWANERPLVKEKIGVTRPDDDERQDMHELLKRVLTAGQDEPEDPFTAKILEFTDTVMTPLVPEGDPIPAHWEEKVATDLLRICVGFEGEVRGTVEVMDALYEKVEEAQSRKVKIKMFAHLYALDQFHYDAKYYQWDYQGTKTQTICEIEFNNPVQETAKEYFLFGAFCEQYAEICEDLVPDLKEKCLDSDRAARIEKQMAIKSAAQQKAENCIVPLLVEERKAPDKMKVIGSKDFQRACAAKKVDGEKILAFYQELYRILNDYVPDESFINEA